MNLKGEFSILLRGEKDRRTPMKSLNEDIKTGNFKVGTKLYESDSRTEYEGTEYVEVTDGKKMGYVREADLKMLY